MTTQWGLVLQLFSRRLIARLPIFLLVIIGLSASGLLAAVGFAQANAGARKADDPPTWVELGENGAIIARQVLEHPNADLAPPCPAIQIKGVPNPPTRMQQRGTPSKDFQAVVCEAVIPSGAVAASIGSIQLPLPKADLSKIVLVGDTGCKGDATGTGMKVTPLDDAEEEDDADPADKAKSKALQDCKSDWPFSTVAQKAANEKPDLIIHVGDFVYVKEENWTQWHYQFFKPAHDLLLAAPWIFVRGNHEDCDLHGTGFFYLLDPRTVTSCANDSSDPYLVKTGGKQFVVMDSSGANCDLMPGEKKCENDDEYQREIKIWTGLFNKAKELTASDAFLLTHRPLWGIKPVKGKQPDPSYCKASDDKRTLVAINSVLQASYENAKMTGVKMVLSGHIHNFQLITYDEQTSGTNPLPQLVVGDSGVELSTPPPPKFKSCKVTAQNSSLGLSTFDGRKEFGFGVLKSDGSLFNLYLKNGDPGVMCVITPHKAKC